MENLIVPGEVVQLTPRVRRLTAPNPGMMTGPGTNSYIVGTGALRSIDPGPDIESHIAAMTRGGRAAACAGSSARTPISITRRRRAR